MIRSGATDSKEHADLDLVCIPCFIGLSLDGQERIGIRL
jgi:stage V sporulation protein SpoVS